MTPAEPCNCAGPLSEVERLRREVAELRGRLRARETRRPLDSILESISDAFFALDRDQRFTYVNRRAEQFWSKPREALLGQNIWEVFPQAVDREIYGKLQRAMRERTTTGFEAVSPVTRLWISGRAYPTPSGGLSVYFQDISERRRAEEALRRSEERYRSLVTASASIVWNADVGGRILQEIPSWETFTGQTFEEYRGIGWLDAVHPEDRLRAAEGRKLTAHAQKPFRAEYRLRDRAGSYRHTVVRGVPIRNEEGEVCEWVGTVTDATERKKAEEALRESEERFRKIVEQSPLAIHVFTPTGVPLRSNTAWKEIWDLGESPAAANVFDEERVRAAGLMPIIESGAAGVETTTEPILYDPARAGLNGEPRWLEAFVYPVHTPGGRLSEVVLMLEDVTERRKAAEERERFRLQEWTVRAEVAERERISRELHDRVAHSMGVVHQSLQLYEALAGVDPLRATEKLELAKKMAKTSLDTTRDLSSELRRSEIGEGLVPALRNLLEVSVPDGIRRELSVRGEESRLPDSLRGQIYLILREAVRNAVRHSGCTNVKVGLRIVPQEVSGFVEDDGQGFTCGGDDPAGLGLRSMEERATLLAGSFKASSAPGKGTRVEVRVPLRQSQGG